jgi:hypothetical protein
MGYTMTRLRQCLKDIKAIEQTIDLSFKYMGTGNIGDQEIWDHNDNMAKIKHKLCNIYCNIENIIQENDDDKTTERT